MIDTHAHLYDEKFLVDEAEHMARLAAAGVTEVWMPNCHSSTTEAMLRWAAHYPTLCRPMMGLHPCYVQADFEQELALVEAWMAKQRFFMVGEIGLDFYWDLTFREEQEVAFRRQMEIAQHYQVPICIHSRNSQDGKDSAILRACEIIASMPGPAISGIFHCFSGNAYEAAEVLALETFLLGIGGVVTYKKSGLAEVLSNIDLKHLVLETDAPYLAPVPFRGKRNEVSYLSYIAQTLADVKGVSKEQVIHQTTENAQKLSTLCKVDN